jgi:uncharacterized protein (DUF1330 family)
MKEIFLEPTQETGAELFSRKIPGEVFMLNLLRFREIADYSSFPELDPGKPISGKEAYMKYVHYTLPFLKESGGDISFLGEGKKYFIGPQDEQWDMVMIIRQNSLSDFLAFASNKEYLAGMGHRTAALEDSRLLPLTELKL